MFKQGDEVRLVKNKSMIGTVMGETKKFIYRVWFDDFWTSAEVGIDMIELIPQPKFKVGDKVRLMKHKYETGRVASVCKNDFGVIFDCDDLNRTLFMREDEIELDKPEPKFKVGDRIVHKYLGRGVVDEIDDFNFDENGFCYRARFGDDVRLKFVTENNMELDTPEPKFKIGDRVRFVGTNNEGSPIIRFETGEDGEWVYYFYEGVNYFKYPEKLLELALDKPEPKFKVGDKIFDGYNKGTIIETEYYHSVSDFGYTYCDEIGHRSFRFEGDLKLAKPEPKFKVGNYVILYDGRIRIVTCVTYDEKLKSYVYSLSAEKSFFAECLMKLSTQSELSNRLRSTLVEVAQNHKTAIVIDGIVYEFSPNGEIRVGSESLEYSEDLYSSVWEE